MTLPQLIKLTKALADPTRFHLLQTIAGSGETSCGELVRQFPVAQATISRHLKILAEAGLVEVRCEGQFHY
jgi:ArsR family transcriptional regulator